jgi:hypothetical protein
MQRKGRVITVSEYDEGIRSPTQPPVGSFRFDEIAGRTKNRSTEPWDVHLFNRWQAAAHRNATKTASTVFGPVFSITSGISDFTVADWHTYASLSVVVGRQPGERKTVPNAATTAEIAAFRRVVESFSDQIDADLRQLPFYGFGESRHVDRETLQVESDESSSERSAWSLSIDFGQVTPYTDEDTNPVFRGDQWNTMFGKLIVKHQLRLMDELMDAGVFVRYDYFAWGATGAMSLAGVVAEESRVVSNDSARGM